MRQRLARFLFVTLTATAACKGSSSAPESATPNVQLSVEEAPPPPTTATGSDRAEGQYKMKNEHEKAGDKQQAIDNARGAGVLGSANLSSGAAMATLTGSGSAAGSGTIAVGRYGTIGHGAGGGGTGTGYGVGGGRGGMHGRVASNMPSAPPPSDPQGSESYKDYGTNAWMDASKDHLSTFAVDVDTASYTIARRKLVEGSLPPNAAVRVEEFVNYFKYAYGAPTDGKPFSVTMDAAPSPFAKDRTLLRVGVASKAISVAERKPVALVFLVDVSGSMQSPDKLELAKRSLRILVDNLKDGDTVALVTYAGSTRLVLPATGLEHKGQIMSAIEDLTAGGGTGMASGIQTAYDEALKGVKAGSTSRVMVLTDGDANIGPSTHEEILKLVAGQVKEGVTLSTIGFGMGNYKDDTMEQLADKGNGNAFYIDGLSAAKRVFQEQLGSTLEVVAQDVKLQVDFDPTLVKKYRLVGYENRDIRDQDFRDDKVDAGEIGAGHQVTAVYELELTPAAAAALAQGATAADGVTRGATTPIAVTRVRWKAPRGTKATEAAYGFEQAHLAPTFAAAPQDLRFAFAVAAFADVLRGGEDAKAWKLGDIRAIANAAAGSDADRAELVSLIDKAIKLSSKAAPATAIAQ